MNSVQVILRLHQHRMWVNRQLLNVVQPVATSQLHQPFPIGQGSIWKTLTHLLAAEHVWLEALLGNEEPLMPGDLAGKLPGNQEAADSIASLEELVDRWQQLDRRWRDYLDSLSQESLDEIVWKVSTSSGLGRRHGTRRGDVLLHVCTHAQYTTAQLVNMLRHVGVSSLPDAMLITMARQEKIGDVVED